MIQIPEFFQIYRRRLAAFALVSAAAVVLSGCPQIPVLEDSRDASISTSPPADTPSTTATTPPATTTPPPETTTKVPPIWRATGWNLLPGWNNDHPGEAWPAFRESCAVLGRRDAWREVCAAASALPATLANGPARQFFEQHFTAWQSISGDGVEQGLITGYYEPLIQGARQRSPAASWPIYAPPEDMLTIDQGGLYPELKSLRLRGRLEGNRVLPYWTREELEQRQSQGKLPAKVLLWAADPVDLFFLQIQGSGQVELPDGSRVRIGFADQNGHPYQSIGSWLIKHGELAAHQASMEGIRQWVHRNPKRLGELLNRNPRFIFFKELPATGGPVGAQGTPLYAGRSIAVDPAHIPLGAPVFLATTQPLSAEPLNRLVVAQDTGSAIKGPVRADFFWGFGPDAGAQAGKMRQQGKIWVLLPKGVEPERRGAAKP
jgi:membrane-bound lytic murein transglycosylase A